MTDTGISDALSAALDQGSFDVLEYVTGDRTPRTKVTIFTDSEAGYRLDEMLEKEEAANFDDDGLSIADEHEWVDEEQVAALRAQVEASALTFHLKGLPPKVREALSKELTAKHNYKEDSDDETKAAYFEEFQNTLVARSIEHVSNVSGATDSSWSAEKVGTLRGRVNAVEFNRLDDAAFKINTDADLYSRAVNADFLSKR